MTDLDKRSGTLHIGFFITPHGFGHAARAVAVMEALYRIRPEVVFEIFTQVPEFFFNESLPSGSFRYHDLMTDIGMAQRSSLEVDLEETRRRLDRFLPFSEDTLALHSREILDVGCRLVVCDIAPMGIAVARTAGIPSVLVENFTWDWIYEEYSGGEHSLDHHAEYLRMLFESVDYRLQTEPAFKHKKRRLLTPPVSRRVRTPREITRKKLNIPLKTSMVMISLGGIPARLPFLDQLKEVTGVCFVIPGSKSYSHEGNVIRLPFDSGYYHPDLIDAADAVIGKPGYSTVAEVYQAGVPFGYIPRSNFRESAVLEAYMQDHMPGFAIAEDTFYDGTWLKRLPELLAIPRVDRGAINGESNGGINGADDVARFILNIDL